MIFITVLITVVYGNTLNSDWHLDDHPNITHNPALKVPITDFESFRESIHYLGKISRPVARATFVFNHILNGDDVFGYHMVNIAIHILSAVVLFSTLVLLCKAPNLSYITSEQAVCIALISSLIWAIHPIQTQAVTYIVQRMASMAAMFYIMGVYFYLKARLTKTSTLYKAVFLGCCVFCFILGMGTKENVVTLPFALILIELLFFRNPSDPEVQRNFLVLILCITILVVFTASIVYLGKNPLTLFQQSGGRFFSPMERFMTQFRVILLYISQILIPVPDRFSIEHDMELSTSLLSPWETLPSVIIVLLLIIYGISRIKKRPVVAFGILFFFLAHTVESTFLSLELVFEHRNYLPSMFLFFPLGAAWVKLAHQYRNNRPVITGLHVVLCLTLFFLGMSTYLRNGVWATEKSLLEDALRKAPDSGRIYHSLAWAHYERIGRYDIALQLYKKALDARVNRKTHKALILNNAAAIHYRFGNYKISAELLKRALTIKPAFPPARYMLASSLAFSGHADAAMDELNILFEKSIYTGDASSLQGLIWLKRKKPEAALDVMQKGVKSDPFNADVLVNIGAAFYQMAEYDKAVLFFKTGRRLFPDDDAFILHLIATHVMRGDMEAADLYSQIMVSKTPALKFNSLFDIFDNRHIIKADRALVYHSICPNLEKTIHSVFEKSCS